MAQSWRVKMFDVGAAAYGFLTAHDAWQRANRRLVSYFPGEVKRVLDVGCGTGATALAEAHACPSAEIVGVDFSREMIARAERSAASAGDASARMRFLVADAAKLPFEDGAFDAVTGHSFLYLLPDRADVLAEVVRVLRPGGRAVFMEPRAGRFSPSELLSFGKDPRFLASMFFWRVVSRVHDRFSARELSAVLAGAGLRPVATEDVLGGLGVIAAAEKPM